MHSLFKKIIGKSSFSVLNSLISSQVSQSKETKLMLQSSTTRGHQKKSLALAEFDNAFYCEGYCWTVNCM